MALHKHSVELEKVMEMLLLSLTEFSESEKKEVVEFIESNEYGLALETVFDIVKEEEKIVSEASKNIMRELAVMMNMQTELDVNALRT